MNFRAALMLYSLLLFTFNANAVMAGSVPLTDVSASIPAVTLAKFPFDYRIDPENVLQIDVYYGKGEKFSQHVRVASTGEINLSFVGTVEVAGLTVGEVQKKLSKLFDKGESVTPQVVVSVEEYSTVTIIGEVRKPGAYPIKSGLSVVELIALAEGFNDIASPNEVKVIHTNADGTKSVNGVKVYDIINKGSGENEGLLLRSRDIVTVPKSTVTIIGEVIRPGVYPTKGHMTLIELVAMAEGFTKFALRNEIKVIHTGSEGARSEKTVPLLDLMNKGAVTDENLLLESGDVVFVH